MSLTAQCKLSHIISFIFPSVPIHFLCVFPGTLVHFIDLYFCIFCCSFSPLAKNFTFVKYYFVASFWWVGFVVWCSGCLFMILMFLFS